MAITKTKFINYIRCPRYVSLDDIKLNKLDSTVSFEEYKLEEQEYYLNDILDDMDEELVQIKDEQLETMLPYYNMVEILAGTLAPKYFDGTFKYAYNTKEQESFDCVINGIRYLCYVDIYNEVGDNFNIIEVKATSTKKFLKLGIKEQSIFKKNNKGIYCLLDELNEEILDINKYNQNKEKLYDKFNSAGHYIYDLAVQRYIIENDLKQNNINKHVKYYLGVLNSDYIYNGKQKNGVNVYDTDDNGNEIIAYFDMSEITKYYINKIDLDRKKVEQYIRNLNGSKCPIGEYCENKKTTKCKYIPICFNNIPDMIKNNGI